MQVYGAPRGGGGGGRGRGRGRGGGGGQQQGYPGQMQPQMYPGMTVAQQPAFGIQPGGIVGQPMYGTAAPMGLQGVAPGVPPYGMAQGNGGFSHQGAGAGRGQAKMASHVVFDRSMLLNVNVQGEQPSKLSSFSLSCVMTAAGQPPSVNVFTGDLNGVTKFFGFEASGWMMTNKIQQEGIITSVFSVHPFLFVAIQQKAPNGHPFGVIKAYNLSTQAQALLQDPSMMPASHNIAVRCMVQTGEFLVSGGSDGHVKAWRMKEDGSWECRGRFGGDAAHGSEVTAMSGKISGILVSGASQGDLRVWRSADGTALAQSGGHVGPVAAIDALIVNETTQFILTCGESDGHIRMWQAPTLTPIYQVTVQPPLTPGVQARPNNPITALKVVTVGNSQQLFVGFWNGNVSVYMMRSENNFQKLGFLDGHERKTKVLAFDTVPTGQAPMLCVVTDNGCVNWYRFTG